MYCCKRYIALVSGTQHQELILFLNFFFNEQNVNLTLQYD